MKCLSILSLSLYTLCAFSAVAHGASPVAQPAASAPAPSNAANKSPTLSVDINQRRAQLLNQLKQTPVPAGTYAELVETYIELEQKIQALNVLQQGLESDLKPEERLKLYALKAQLTALKDADIEEINLLLLSADPSSEVLQIFEGFLEQEAGELYLIQLFEAAKVRLNQALQNDNTLEQLQLLKRLDALQPAFDAISQRRYRFLLEDAWEQHPQAQVVRTYVVREHLKNKTYEDLLAFYRRELQLFARDWTDAQRSQAFQHIADLHFKLGYLNFAERNYDIALKQDPDNLTALLRQGMTELARQDFGAAEKKFRTIFQRNPLNIENRYLLALTYYYKGAQKEAEQILSGLSEPPPEHLKDIVALAQVSKNVPPRLWESLSASPTFLSHL